MNRRVALLSALLLGGLVGSLSAQVTLDLGSLTDSTRYGRGINSASSAGVPLSATVGDPLGSNGRGFLTQTPSQFKSVLSGNGLVHPGPAGTASYFTTPPSPLGYAQNAVTLKLPHNTVGALKVVLARASLGAPYYSRSVSIGFGSIIGPPKYEENGAEITGRRPEDYWNVEPEGHTDNPVVDRYYWSPHAGVVFATQPGPVNITWRKKKPENPVPADSASRIAAKTLVLDSGLYFALTNMTYVVSGSPAPGYDVKQMYWTERTFSKYGKTVAVPKGSVDLIYFIHNSGMPKEVNDPYYVPGETVGLVNPSTMTNTIWVENGAIHAYNAVGRLFVEMLGEVLPTGNRRFLGAEIVDVVQYAQPSLIAADLGDIVGPEKGGANPDGLHPEIVQTDNAGAQFLYSQISSVGSEPTYYAAYGTSGDKDALIHWTVDGVAGLRWPKIFAAYKLDWPVDPTRYEHYVRSSVTTRAEANQTAVALPSGIYPVISYQDPLPLPKGGWITPGGSYSSMVDASDPVHRALLRFQVDKQVAFTRVLSWLDDGLKSPLNLLAGSVATNLTDWNQPTELSNADFKDLSAFAGRIISASDGYSAYLKARMSSATTTAMNLFRGSPSAKNRSSLLSLLLPDLTTVLNEPWSVTAARPGNVLAPLPSPKGLTSWTGIASSSDGMKLLAANGSKVADGYLWISGDSGMTWNTCANAGFRKWSCVASSADGSALLAGTYLGAVYVSMDSGATWVSRSGNAAWESVATSADGTIMYAANDSGVTKRTQGSFATILTNAHCKIACSKNGTKVLVAGLGSLIGTSTDSGTSFTWRDAIRAWSAVASSGDGTKLVAVENGGKIYISANSGVTWTPKEQNRTWNSVAMSSDGNIVTATTVSNGVFYSLDAGVTWSLRATGSPLYDSSTPWTGVAVSDSGEKMFFVTADGPIASNYLNFDPISADQNTFAINRLSLDTVYPDEIYHNQTAINDESFVLATGDFTDVDAFAKKLASPPDAYSGYLKGRLTPVALMDLTNYLAAPTPQNGVRLAQTLGKELTVVLSEPETATPMWPGTALTPGPSPDGAKNWRCLAASSDGVHLIAGSRFISTAGYDVGYLYTSQDSGLTWSWCGNAGGRRWTAVASSADGSTLVAAALYNGIYKSTDYGVTWTAVGPYRAWVSLACSSNAQIIYAGTSSAIYKSADNFQTVLPVTFNSTLSGKTLLKCGLSCSGDGTKIIASRPGSPNFWVSTNSGTTWVVKTYDNKPLWSSVACSPDGSKMVAAQYNGYIYTSVNSGANFTRRAQGRSWLSLAMSANGNVLLAGTENQGVYSTLDGGVTWKLQEVKPSIYAGNKNWIGAAMSQDGSRWFVVPETGNLAQNSLQFSPIDPGLSAYQINRQLLEFSYPAMFTHQATTVSSTATQRPRIIRQTVAVGNRINAPSSEAGDGSLYRAGHIVPAQGTSYDVTAYVDPMVNGFSQANQGAIIPVNALPGQNQLEVWWFRQQAGNAVLNAANGVAAIFWPSVIGRYTLQWPSDAKEIVLASNAGSGPLASLESKGTIYVQNAASLAGFNPNEEHALMIGGQVYALRDDLNKTDRDVPAILEGVSTSYSSEPFVLLRYTEQDGRPAIRAYQVLREKPEAGLMFDYLSQAGGNIEKGGAGSILQAPMPLPFLPPPVETVDNVSVNYNTETSQASGDKPPQWTDPLEQKYPNYSHFTFLDRKNNFWVYRGVHQGLPALDAGTYNSDPPASFSHTLPEATAVLGQPFTNYFHATRLGLAVSLKSGELPEGLALDGMTLAGTPVEKEGVVYPWTGSFTFVIADAGDGASVEVALTLNIESSGIGVSQDPLTISTARSQSDSKVTFIGRPPFLAETATPTNSFTMRFYYKTQEGFAWPGLVAPPEVGSVVPYLRPLDSAGQPVGDPTTKTEALDIVYRPFWANNPPKMPLSYTLNDARFNLPAIRGNTSVEVLYEQSIATNVTHIAQSVVLHDPEREKTYDLREGGLNAIPSSVRTQSSQGKTYFPNLPPHLVKRFYYDPLASPLGSLVFKGEYKAAVLGDSYLMLNVLRGDDLATVKALLSSDATQNERTKWDEAVESLSTTLETFIENPAVKGTYIPDSNNLVVKRAGDLVEILHANTAVTSYALSANGPGQGYVTLVVNNSLNPGQTPSGDPISLFVIKVGGSLYPGEIKIVESDNPLSEISVFQHSLDFGGNFSEYEYQWQIAPPVGGSPPPVEQYQPLADDINLPRYILGGSGIQTLVDNYIRMRYRPLNPLHPRYNTWSDWTDPQLAEGWIKRVLAGINPFNQRVTDLYNNSVNTDANMLTSAGKRWEGNIPLNLANINNYGLIEIYETVLKKGRGLSIDAGVNFGPANDALLLAAGYLNDLYMMVGNEAYADAANPTIGIGTKDSKYGDIATALFAFKGQEPSLLEEELALLRGRDDTLVPGVQTAPVYNRLVWNYTRGIDSGEVIYALNYNILDQNNDGRVNAEDAAVLYPQGHGDAYGHYLTAVKGYYSLFLNNSFSWVPSSEAVTILGKAVAVDYQDERKFATSAAALARTGRQIFDLTWRRDYLPGKDGGWSHLSSVRESERTVLSPTGSSTNHIVREWGVDQWGSRVGQGAFQNWVVGNVILPFEDPDVSHEGIQKIDRTTVPELKELATLISDLQGDMDTAEGGLTPLGLVDGSLAFDIDPNLVTGANPQTHFEQVYGRCKVALNNAIIAFDDAKDVTRLMRSEQDSLEDFQTTYDQQELAYNSALIEIYGTPYPDDIGAGRSWPQGYEGPDLLNYRYVDNPEFINGGEAVEGSGVDAQGNAANAVWDANGSAGSDFQVDIQSTDVGLDHWPVQLGTTSTIVPSLLPNGEPNPDYKEGVHWINFHWGAHGFLEKPTTFKGKRKSPGNLQRDISEIIAAYNHLFNSVTASMVSDKEDLDKMLQSFGAQVSRLKSLRDNFVETQKNTLHFDRLERFRALVNLEADNIDEAISGLQDVLDTSIPETLVAGLAFGGSVGSAAKGAVLAPLDFIKDNLNVLNVLANVAVSSDQDVTQIKQQSLDLAAFDLDATGQLQQAVVDLGHAVKQVQGDFILINEDTRAMQNAYEKYRQDVAAGERLQIERQVFRKRAAAVVQGYRTRDAAFRIFRNEKLERYKSLFDLAARYSYLAANAYDYETGLLKTEAGKSFINRIVSARSLGVVKNGEPQFGGSDMGDPGLSSALAEMKADWDVLRGRLGFNNPDAYGTTVSLRQEDRRILPGTDGDSVWQDYLQGSVRANLLDDADVRRHCLQIDTGSGLPIPGIVLEFSTSINPGENLFGRPLAAGDNAFHRSAFATKIFAAGVALEGYVGMNNPVANGSAVGGGGAVSPGEPPSSLLNPQALASTPYVYLIPVGLDAMRSPPLGDVSTLRTWQVQDVTIPMPFNVGASDFSRKNFYQTTDSLSEPLFDVRKHQAFRPVSTTAAFNADIYGGGGSLKPSQFTNRRLIGRSVWNSKWKLVIPGDTLLNDPKEGLARFINSVKDVKLHFVTYSYSGN